MKNNLKSLIENIFNKNNMGYKFYDKDAVAFGYYNGILRLSNYGETHDTMYNGLDREDYDYAGRMWTERKIISFCKYPEDKNKLDKILKDIGNVYKRKFNKNIDFSDWVIEILINNQNSVVYQNNDTINYETMLIPIKFYKSSLKRGDLELTTPHELSPITKGNRSLHGFGSEHSKYKEKQKYNRKLGLDHKISLKSLIKETPDEIVTGPYDLYHGDEDAVSFGYKLDKYFGTDEKKMWVKTGENSEHIFSGHKRYEMKYSGRFWTDDKLISFWEYPENNIEMKKVINDIEIAYKEKYENDIDIWNVYMLELYDFISPYDLLYDYYSDDDDEKDITDEMVDEYMKNNFEYYYEYDNGTYVVSEFIPVKYFKKSKEIDDETMLRKNHELSPIAKGNKSLHGFGSSHRKYQKRQDYNRKLGLDHKISLKLLVIGKINKKVKR